MPAPRSSEGTGHSHWDMSHNPLLPLPHICHHHTLKEIPQGVSIIPQSSTMKNNDHNTRYQPPSHLPSVAEAGMKKMKTLFLTLAFLWDFMVYVHSNCSSYFSIYAVKTEDDVLSVNVHCVPVLGSTRMVFSRAMCISASLK